MGYPVPATALERPIEGFGSFFDCLLRTGSSVARGWSLSMLRVAMMRTDLPNHVLQKFL